MEESLKLKVRSSKLIQSPIVAFLWDESFLWGLMAYKALKANGLPFELIRSDEIKNGCLKNYRMLFVPGGWASNKLKTLGDNGISEIKKFVRNGGNYLGFCGGAGLATMDGIGLLPIKRMPTKDRVPSFSGRINLSLNVHPVWDDIKKSGFGKKLIPNPQSLTPVFHAWWPSQFLIEDMDIKILAAYGEALPDSFSSDLNVGDVNSSGGWDRFEKAYGINLDPGRLLNEPAVVEGTYGKGKAILSLIHFDTPDDANGAVVLKSLWEYLAQNANALSYPPLNNPPQPLLNLRGGEGELRGSYEIQNPKFKIVELVTMLENAVSDLIALGIRNFLWFWRNPMLLQWRRGVRGLEYCTLYVMIKELSSFSGQLSAIDKEKLQSIKKLLIPFTEKAKQLLILERHAMQNGHITYEKCGDPEMQKIRTELFGNSKSYGGLFKALINDLDSILYFLIKQR
ncbi:MAG: hypothetical protein EPN94_11710 [Nitrospirae bacterium]|nr:MAG: hypothetical protein EPN94_11710 [Nitrospirota bacterium]